MVLVSWRLVTSDHATTPVSSVHHVYGNESPDPSSADAGQIRCWAGLGWAGLGWAGLVANTMKMTNWCCAVWSWAVSGLLGVECASCLWGSSSSVLTMGTNTCVAELDMAASCLGREPPPPLYINVAISPHPPCFGHQQSAGMVRW